jgi:hypothetical protein
MVLNFKSPKTKYSIFALIIGFTFLLFGSTIGNSYNLDDELVTKNHRLTSKGISAIPEIFNSPYYQDDMGYSYEYRPVVLASFAIEHSLFGESPKVSHFINVLLYSLTCIMLFILLSNLFPNLNIIFPLTVVLLFVAHPLHTEVVASIKNRDEILALLFLCLSMNSFMKLIIQKKWWFGLFSIVFLVFGMLSKITITSIMLLLPVIVIYRYKLSVFKFVLLLIIQLIFFLIFSNAVKFQLSYLQIFIYLLFLSVFHFYHNYNAFYVIFQSLIEIFRLNIKSRKISDVFTSKQPLIITNFTVKTSFYFVAMLSILLLTIGAYLYFPGNNYLLRYLFVFFTLSFIFIIDSSKFLVLLLPLAIITIIDTMQFSNDIFLMILIVCSYTILISENKKSKYLTLILVLIYPIFYYRALNDTYGIIFIPTFFLAASFLSRIYKLIIVFAILLIVFISTINEYFISPIILILIAYLAFETIYNYKKPMQKIASFFIIFSCLFSQGLMELDWSRKSTISSSQDEPISISINNSVDLEKRPIDFVEFPLGFDASLNEKVGTAAHVLAEYMKLMLVPHPMAFYYGYAQVVPVGLDNIQSVISILLHLILLAVALALIRRHPIFSFGILFYLFSIAIFSNLVQPVVGMMADRFTYVATVGFCIVLAYLLLKIFKIDIDNNTAVNLKPAFTITMILILGSYSYLTIARNAQWKDHLTLMRHDIKHLDKSAQGHNLLASNLMKYSFQREYAQQSNAMHKEAAFHFRRATEIYPDFFNAWHDLGRTYMIMNNIDSAFVCFVKVHNMDSTLSDATLNIAMIADQKQDYNTAIKYYERLIKFSPYVQEGYANLSYLYFRLQQPYKSIEVNKKAIAYNPNWKEPYENIERVESFLKQNNIPLQP